MNQPEQFIQEKLSKKSLSANTVRDLILAAFLVALQKQELTCSETGVSEDWTALKAIELRAKASHIFASIGAPFEYPTRLQLERASEGLKKVYALSEFPDEIQSVFDHSYEQILSKFSEKF